MKASKQRMGVNGESGSGEVRREIALRGKWRAKKKDKVENWAEVRLGVGRDRQGYWTSLRKESQALNSHRPKPPGSSQPRRESAVQLAPAAAPHAAPPQPQSRGVSAGPEAARGTRGRRERRMPLGHPSWGV